VSSEVFKCKAVPPILLPLDCQELRADLERQRRVLQNAAIIQAKDQEERARISAGSQPTVVENPHPPISQGIRTEEQGSTLSSSDVLETPPLSSHTHDVKRAPRPSHSPGLPPTGKDRDWQPEAWTPQTIRRGGG
jgi:NADH dehydrogenase [ubiquinone] 1 alpha subcomplex assembly factor 2